MFCNNCGKELMGGATFCSGCGTNLQAPQQYQPPPQYAQYAPPPGYAPGYGAPPPLKKSKKPLFVIAGVAAAALVFIFAILPLTGGGSDADIGGDDVLSIEIGTEPEPPGGGELPLEPEEGGFVSSDPSIRMIEVNQCLSYGFDTDTGEFYLMDNFVAGKETAVFVSLAEAPGPNSEIMLKIERDGKPVGTLLPEKTDDPSLLLFQPKDISEVGGWSQGAYTFTLTIDDKYAIRKTNFLKAMPVKILFVPILGNYSGEIVACKGEWKDSGEMFTACYPVGKEDVEFVYGPEIDLSDDRYDLDTDDGRHHVWQALNTLQTPNNDYILIVGFMRDPIYKYPGMARVSGYATGLPSVVCTESMTGKIRTVIHEAAHCWCIGDEYPTGYINNVLNPPPYLMEGRDIISRQPDAGSKEKVVGGRDMGLEESQCGSVIYPEQRAYWVEKRRMMGMVASYMSWDSEADPLLFWVTSDIWNHLYKIFTGQITGRAPGYEPRDSNSQDDFIGICSHCGEGIYNPLTYVKCPDCNEYILFMRDPVECKYCNAKHAHNSFTSYDLYIECPFCWDLTMYKDISGYNNN